MAEWINPKYADIIAALRRARASGTGRDADQQPVRLFLYPPAK